MKQILIFIVILYVLIMTLTSCVTGDKYYTYQLDAGSPEYRGEESNWRTDYINVRKLRVINNSNSSVKNKEEIFTFTMYETTQLDNGNIFTTFFDTDKDIYTEPYILSLYISFEKNVQNIVFNKIELFGNFSF